MLHWPENDGTCSLVSSYLQRHKSFQRVSPGTGGARPKESTMRSAFIPVMSLLLLAALATGCHVNTQKNGRGDNVDIGTPFGSMSVKTNGNVDPASIGMTVYPGSVLAKGDDGDKDAANVNMNFGSFHLGVKVATYQSADGKDKILAFYRKDLARYGTVIECHGHNAVGSPATTSEGLSCNDNHDYNGRGSTDDDAFELRAGSKQLQHIVAVDDRDGGTKIALVNLQLPKNFSRSSDDSSE
jgi:hypothetical protein